MPNCKRRCATIPDLPRTSPTQTTQPLRVAAIELRDIAKIHAISSLAAVGCHSEARRVQEIWPGQRSVPVWCGGCSRRRDRGTARHNSGRLSSLPGLRPGLAMFPPARGRIGRRHHRTSESRFTSKDDHGATHARSWLFRAPKRIEH